MQTRKRIFTEEEVKEILKISKEEPLLTAYEILEKIKADYDVEKKLSYKNTINKIIRNGGYCVKMSRRKTNKKTDKKLKYLGEIEIFSKTKPDGVAVQKFCSDRDISYSTYN